MMRQMRENTKWIMLVTALAFVALMVFEWGMDASGRGAGGPGELGQVNGTPIVYDQYYATYRNLYDQAQASQEEPISSQQNREIEDRAWDESVNQVLIQQELDRRGIRVTDEEIRQAARYSPPPELRSSPVFQTDGQFDLGKYQQFLASNAADEQLLFQLESYYRDVIPRSKLMRQVTSGMYVTDAELWRAYRDQNEQVRVAFTALDPAERIPDDQVSIEPSAVRDYFREHENEFEIPARATVRAVVLQKAPTAADTAAARERAEEVARRIREGEDFAEVAGVESADEGSAAQGGDLGWFGRGDMVAAFEDAAFSAPIGEVTGPVQSRFGFHVLEVTERAGDSLRARHVLVPAERTDDSELELLDRADSIEAMMEDRPLAEAARVLGLEIRETEITDAFPFLPGAGQISEGADWVFEESEPGAVSPLFENRQAFYAFEVVRSSPGGVMSLEEARPTILEILRLRAKLERAREQGGQLVREIRGGRSLEEVAATRGLEVREEGPFSRFDFVPGIGRANRAVGAAFGLREGRVSDVVVTEDNAYILRLLERIPADSAAFEENKRALRAQMTPALQQARLEEWLDGLRESARIVDRRDEVLRPADEVEEQPFGGFPAF